jgi:hypothetical protein
MYIGFGNDRYIRNTERSQNNFSFLVPVSKQAPTPTPTPTSTPTIEARDVIRFRWTLFWRNDSYLFCLLLLRLRNISPWVHSIPYKIAFRSVVFPVVAWAVGSSVGIVPRLSSSFFWYEPFPSDEYDDFPGMSTLEGEPWFRWLMFPPWHHHHHHLWLFWYCHRYNRTPIMSKTSSTRRIIIIFLNNRYRCWRDR